MRPSGRAPDQMRDITMEPGFTIHAEGSCLVSFGDTRVLCTASIEEKVPPFLRGKGSGWVTAEYGMLPRATHTRGSREAAKGKQSGRTQEIQRLIGRSLRAALDLEALGERTLLIDCDVLQADAGTRTASISGAWVVLSEGMRRLVEREVLQRSPLQHQVTAVSVGVVDGLGLLDLDYSEDSRAEVDLNVVCDDQGRLLEIQGTAEGAPFRRDQLDGLLDLADGGLALLRQAQREALESASGGSTGLSS